MLRHKPQLDISINTNIINCKDAKSKRQEFDSLSKARKSGIKFTKGNLLILKTQYNEIEINKLRTKKIVIGINRKFNQNQIKDIKQLIKNKKHSLSEIGRLFGVQSATISQIANNITYNNF